MYISINFKVKILLPVLILVFTIFSSAISAQNQNQYQWWNTKHNWDGKTPPLNYIVRNSGHLGPNALPIPDLNDSKIGYRTYFYGGARYQFQNNEKVFNPEIGIYFPIQKNRIAFSFYSRLFEFYRTDTTLRDSRFARDQNTKGTSKSESFLTARARVWENFYFFPDFTIEFGLKLNTGKNLENARHSNAPGYWFDGNFGKDILKWRDGKFRLIAMLGGFIWQAGDNLQNDSWLYGFGFQYKNPRNVFFADISSYRGYRNNGDRPMVLRIKFEREFNKVLLFAQYQKGINDFILNGLFLGARFKLDFIDKKNPY